MALNGHRLTASGNAIWMRQETKEEFKSLEQKCVGFFSLRSHIDGCFSVFSPTSFNICSIQ